MSLYGDDAERLNDYEDYTEELRKRARNSRLMLEVLEEYVELGEKHFHPDLVQARLQKNPNECTASKERRANLIRDIENDILEYNAIKEELRQVIRAIRIDPANVNNPLAQRLFVEVLRGSGFFERYTEDVHYALEEINADEDDIY
jgi:hypothetical protein